MRYTDRDLIASIIGRDGRVPLERLLADEDFAELGIDSLELLSAAFALEEKFAVEFDDDALRNMRTFSQFADYLDLLIGGKNE
jgi:acyl carrier protein